ncbi:MAG TPA: choice-of-anchor tandem repeat GloVer-containing protein [Chthoniobacteraceae bacterium]|jgi:uncharacterized repeat protein (TIGR03803 family)|nr:choice-of-anchor tandem repeat GloVer-containing protein [Chthoniobacteraceae bacterium]
MSFLRLLPSVVVAAFLALYTPAALSAPHELVSRFSYGPRTPNGALTLGPDGYYWGTSVVGGARAKGTVYKVKPDGSDLHVVYSFGSKPNNTDGTGPQGGLTYDGVGFMWGTTYSGGFNGKPNIFGDIPTYGTIFKIKVSTGTLTTLVRFGDGRNKGAFPVGTLLKVGAYMWGTATGGGGPDAFGTVFKVSSAGTLTTVVPFAGPAGTSIQPLGNLFFDGKLFWGTTTGNGFNTFGTIFSIDAKGKATTAITFTGTGGANKGSRPEGALVGAGAGVLWGTTRKGGAGDLGTIFKLDTATKVLSTLVEFTGNVAPNKGAQPGPGLLSDGAGAFWGATLAGGSGDGGTVFKIDQVSEMMTTEAIFSSAGGGPTSPNAPLLSDGAGNFLGTASGGGEGSGLVFKVSQTTGTVSPLADFNGIALNPRGGLTADSAGYLWGIAANSTDPTSIPGTSIFKYDRLTGLRTRVATFPFDSSVLGKLYFDGAHTFWGAGRYGSAGDGIFKVDATTGALTSVLNFSGANDGSGPLAGLVSDGHGLLWGTNSGGGSSSDGTVFTFNPANNAFTPILSFSDTGAGNHGKNPAHALVDDGVDSMWGTNDGGMNGGGTIFKINKTSHVLTTLVEFGTTPTALGVLAASPKLGINDGAGNIWGVKSDGIMKIDITSGMVTTYPTASTEDGHASNGDFVSDGSGAFWDTFGEGGGLRSGSVVKIDRATGARTTVTEFGGNGTLPGDASGPGGPLYLAPDGYFYGTARAGATDGGGAIFRVSAAAVVTPNIETLAVVGALSFGSYVNGLGSGTFAGFLSPQPGVFGAKLRYGTKTIPATIALDGTLLVLPTGGSQYDKIGEPSGSAAVATLRHQGFNTAKNDEVLLGYLGSTPKFVARKGDLVSGPAGGYIKKFLAFDGNGPPYFFVAVLDRFGPTVTSLCVTLADGDSLNFNTIRALVRIGGNIDGNATPNTVKTLATLVALKGTVAEGRWRLDASHFGARLTLSDKSQALFSMPSSATMSTASEWTRYLGTGDPFGSFKVGALGFPGFGALGPATVVTLVSGAMPVDPAHNTLVVRSDAASDTVLARKGDPAPDAAGVAIPNAVFKSFGDPVSGSAGKTAFTATLGGVTTGTSGIWYAADGVTLKQLARVGDLAPGGGRWASFVQLVLPDGAGSGPHFLGTLTVDKAANISTANNTGIWSVKSDGTLQLTFRTGGQFDVNGAGKLLTVKSFTAFQAAANSLGAARGYDDSGHVAVLATFTDKTVALLRLTVP